MIARAAGGGGGEEGLLRVGRDLLERLLVALERSETTNGHLAQRVDTEHMGYCGWKSESSLCVAHRKLVADLRLALRVKNLNLVKLMCKSPRTVGSSRGRDIRSWSLPMPSQGTTLPRTCARCGATIVVPIRHAHPSIVVWCIPCIVADPDCRANLLSKTGIGPCGCCRVWLRPAADGYGMARIRNQRVVAHRLFWLMERGPIPDGLMVCHDCPCSPDRRDCCDPSHMFLGTGEDNMQDASRKGRTLTGERHPGVVLSESQVSEIRQRYAIGEHQRTLASEFGVAQTTISALCRGKNWRVVDDGMTRARGTGPCRTCGQENWSPNVLPSRRCLTCRLRKSRQKAKP